MKKLITMMLALAILVVPALMTDQKVYADSYGDFEYDLYTDEVTGVESVKITGYTGSDIAVTIPASIDGKAVTRIDGYAFAYNTSIMQLTIPDSVKAIGYSAFDSCTSLMSVNLGNGVEVLESYAFNGCESLRSISLPSSLKKIEGSAFSYSSLQSITVPDSVTDLGGAFSSCAILKTATIGSGVTVIPDSLFYGCEILTSVTIKGEITSIGDSAFANCKALKSIALPNSLLKIGSSAFSNCEALEAIEIPASVLKIDEYTFQYCTNLQSAVMGEGIVSIGYGAFEYCENLESINLPQDLVSVDRYAFDGCNALKYVFFKGTKEQWEGMIIKEDNDPLKNAAAHFNAIGHAYKETVVPPTCTEQGYTVYTCTCGDTYKDKFTNVAGHNYSKTFTIDKQATMKANGSKSRHCTACDATTDKKTIYKASTVKLSTTKYVYNGKTKSPSIVIKDSKGNTISNANYKVTKPSGRKNVGKYTYKITFKNEYSGSKSLYLTINPKAPTIKTPAAAKKAMTVKWSKVSSQATGYEIMYTTNSKFTKGKKTVKVTSYKTTSKKISKLTSKKIYYVKIRTYKTVKGVKYYSAWSKVKSVKVK